MLAIDYLRIITRDDENLQHGGDISSGVVAARDGVLNLGDGSQL